MKLSQKKKHWLKTMHLVEQIEAAIRDGHLDSGDQKLHKKKKKK